MGVEPKIGGKPPKSSHFNRVFSINHPFWGKTHYFWKHPNIFHKMVWKILDV